MKTEPKINKSLTKKFGRNIKDLREAKGLTREELSELAETSPQNLARIENGQRFVSSIQLANLAKALEANIEDLFKDESSVRRTSAVALTKIERLLKNRPEKDIEFAHSLLSSIFKRISK